MAFYVKQTVRMQCAVRGWRARKLCAERREQRRREERLAAAVCVQQWWRMLRQRRAEMLQRALRARAAKFQLEVMCVRVRDSVSVA